MNKKQNLIIAALIVAGLVLAALILTVGKPAPQGAEAEHAEQGGHDDDHADEKPAAKAKEGHDEHADEAAGVVLNQAQIDGAGIKLHSAGPASIGTTLTLPGEIQFNQDRTAHVVPRLAGVVERVHADLGQMVKKNQVLAIIASSALSEMRSELITAQRRLSLARSTHDREQRLWQEKISAEQDFEQARTALQEAEIAVQNARQKLHALGTEAARSGGLSHYEIRAPFDGMVTEKHLVLGEAVKEDANIFIISDLSTVWTDIAVPASQLNAVKVGEKARVSASAMNSSTEGRITYVGSLLGEQTRTAKARVTLANPAAAWRPGLFVTVEVVSGASLAPVTVLSSALQTIDDNTVVFVRSASGFVATPVTVGRNDGKLAEITKGLAAGASYAADGSFVLKSELGKASAEHSH